MKKMTTILGLVLISSTVFASSAVKMEGYDCGLQVGKSLAILSSSSVKQDAQNLSEDIANYSAQMNLASKTRKKDDKAQLLQAANSSWQSISYSMNQIGKAAPEEAKAIEQACGLGYSAE